MGFFFPVFFLTVMEWVAFVSLDSVFGTRGVIWWLPGGYSLGMWWESGLGLVGVCGFGVFLWTLTPVRLGAGTRGLALGA